MRVALWAALPGPMEPVTSPEDRQAASAAASATTATPFARAFATEAGTILRLAPPWGDSFIWLAPVGWSG